jgi:alpha-tubulin suppressor-like RCC1 family protein/DNA-binding beta-propeller fold protein YncE
VAAVIVLLVSALLQPPAHAVDPISQPAIDGWATKSVPLPTYDSAFDRSRNKVLVTVRSVHPSLGNMLVEMDPNTGALGRRLFVGSEPKQVAVTDDGAFAYVGLGGTNRVVKVDLATFTVALSFATGPDTGTSGPLFPQRIKPLPGRNDAVAVSVINGSGDHSGIWIFVDGVPLPTHTDMQTPSDHLEFVNPSEIMGFKDHGGYYAMLRYEVDSSGVRRTAWRQEGFAKKAYDIRYLSGKLYYSSGFVTDAVTGATLPALPVDNGRLVEVNPATSQIAFLAGNSIVIFDAASSAQIAARNFPELPAGANSFVATSDGFVVAAKDQVFLLGPQVGGDAIQVPPGPAGKIEGWKVRQLPISAYRMAYDESRELLYVTSGGQSQTYPNRLLAVHPKTGEVLKSIQIGQGPGPLALSEDRSRLFVGIQGTGQVKQVDLASFAVIKTFSLGNSPFVAATDIAVMPGDRDTVAVTLHEAGSLDWKEGVALYRNGVQIGPRTSVQMDPQYLAFGDAGHLYGVDSSGNFWRMSVDDSGIHLEPNSRVLMPNTADLTITGGIAYSTRGDSVDPVAGQLLGRFDAGTNPNGLRDADGFVAVPSLGRAFLSRYWGVVEEYDLEEFRLVSTLQVPSHLYNMVYTAGGIAAVTFGGGLLLLSPDSAPQPPTPQPALAWGYNGLGALGSVGAGPSAATPAGCTNVKQVSAGTYHSVALKSDGTVWTWGYNGFGSLGDGTTTDRAVPVRVPDLGEVVAVSAGMLHSLALKADGTVWAWGWNVHGQLGTGSTADLRKPAQVSGLSKVSSISAGALHSLAAKSDGTVWSWGYNGLGTLGDGTTVDRYYPVKASGISNVIAVSAGGFHSTALDGLGKLWSWGYNAQGQLGDGSTTDRKMPFKLSSSEWREVSAGYLHSVGRSSGGNTFAWGWNGFGQLGDGTTVDRQAPTQISLSGARSVSAGMYHSVAAGDGTVFAWGWNVQGQLGNDTRVDRHVPTAVPGTGVAHGVSAGGLHSLGVRGS